MEKIKSNLNNFTVKLKKSESDKENKLKTQNKKNNETLKDKINHAMILQNSALREIKKSSPINKSGMTNKLSDVPDNKNNHAQSLPNSSAMSGSVSLPLLKNKPLPALPEKSRLTNAAAYSAATVGKDQSLQHHSFKLSTRSKPLPPLPKPRQQLPLQPLPQPAVIAVKNLEVGVTVSQMALFKNAMNTNSQLVEELIGELNKFPSDKPITALTCQRFATHAVRVGIATTQLKAEIKQDVKRFATAWLAMKTVNKVVDDAPWDDAVTMLADSVIKNWR